MIQRIDELTAPPVIGQFYLVPTVEGYWYSRTASWPVIGPKHNDAQCLAFEHQHYHLDARFLVERVDELFWRFAFSMPMSITDRKNTGGLPAPVWRRRVCRRLANPAVVKEEIAPLIASNARWKCHFAQWEGKQARHDGRGWVCPHRSVPLADHPAVDGVITCPLHLLRIDAATGRVLPREVAA